MDVWSLDTKFIELGAVSIRNSANYNSVTSAWWPTETCMICGALLRRNYFLGFASHYDRSLNCVRMRGPGYFCSLCEDNNRLIMQILTEWEVLALDQAEWEDILTEEGELQGTQVYLHDYFMQCRERKTTFAEVYDARKLLLMQGTRLPGRHMR